MARASRQPIFDALAEVPEGVWPVYLTVLRSINQVVGSMILDDDAVTWAVEEAIAANLDEPKEPV